MRSVLIKPELFDYCADAALGWRQMGRHWPGPGGSIADWLHGSGSLTKRLQSISADSFKVRVVSEGWVYRTVCNTGLSSRRSFRQMMWSRQVVLGGYGEDWVAAHSLIPFSSLKGRQRILTSLGDKPLGGFLFRQPTLKRGHLEIGRIGDVWGRRSLFFLEDRPLLVAEFFLPDLIRRTQQPA